MFVGGRDGCSVLDISHPDGVAQSLAAGAHVLENRPFTPESPKARNTRLEIEALELEGPIEQVAERLRRLFASVEPADDDDPRPAELRARTVHFGVYGTRTFSVFAVPDAGPPVVFFTDGPPDTSELLRFAPADG
ncbi:MAG: hypothetical protein ACJAYU_003409 [Bradymonadia bacterium]|jgi:hypothetical protein